MIKAMNRYLLVVDVEEIETPEEYQAKRSGIIVPNIKDKRAVRRNGDGPEFVFVRVFQAPEDEEYEHGDIVCIPWNAKQSVPFYMNDDLKDVKFCPASAVIFKIMEEYEDEEDAEEWDYEKN